jgi:transposase
MATLFGMFPFLKTLFADGGYQGPQFAKAVAKVLPHLDVEIVKRSDRVSGFVVLPKRWIPACAGTERSIAWLNRCRRLAKDWENPQPKGARVECHLGCARAQAASDENLQALARSELRRRGRGYRRPLPQSRMAKILIRGS